MSKIQQAVLIIIISITDAYMISHPNLLGKIGMKVYNYDMFRTFPAAFITILSTVGVSFLVASFLENKIGKKWAKYMLTFFLVLSLIILIQVYFKFSTGSYAHSGKVFIFGMHLFPILLIYVFGNGLWNWILKSKI